MPLASPEVSAIAALAGSAIGGVTPLISNYVSQRSITRRELLSRELNERQTLYAEFMRFAATVYVQARTSSLEKLDDLVILHSYVGRMRLLASPPVIEAAEEFAQIVTRNYGEQNVSIDVLRESTLADHVEPLKEFSLRCREELDRLIRSGTL